MKKLLTILTVIMLSLVVCRSSFAALNANIVFEVRTTGASTNGGGFKTGASGTDYSQQDAAQISRTDLVIGNPTTTNLTSAATPFTTAEIGNLIQITAGTNFTTGFYEITAVAANVATVDRSVGTAGSTGGTGAVGGAVDHPNTISASVVAGNTIYIQNGTYQKVGANAYILQLNTSGGTATIIKWIGFITNHSTIPTGTNRPLFDGNSSATNCIIGNSKINNGFENIRCANATGDGISGAATCYFVNIKSSSNGGDGFDTSGPAFLNCESSSNTSDGFNPILYTGVFLFYCYIHDNTAKGIEGRYATPGWAAESISESNAGWGFSFNYYVGNSVWVKNCVAYNNTGVTTDGFDFGGSGDYGTSIGTRLAINCLSSGNGRYGFNEGISGQMFYFDYNIYNGNATAGLNNITAGAHDLTTAPSFVDAANGDFTVSSGGNSIGAGFPQTMPGATGDYQWNIGVDQDDNTAAGGGIGISNFFSMGD